MSNRAVLRPASRVARSVMATRRARCTFHFTLVLHLIYGAVLGGTYGLEHPDPLPQFQVTHR